MIEGKPIRLWIDGKGWDYVSLIDDRFYGRIMGEFYV